MSSSIRPFPGLRPFRQDEAHLFFGRDTQIDDLLLRLRRTRFVAVVGTSGSGKSSLVRAGLLPVLARGYRGKAGSKWRIAVFRPGHNPMTRLAEVLAEPADDGAGRSGRTAPDSLQVSADESVLRRGGLGLVEVFRQGHREADENLLVVVDQFEELFPVTEDGRAFVALLLEATRQVGVPIYVVLTMRSDYLGACAQFRGLPEAINDSQFLVSRLTRTQRQEVIEGPVAVAGGAVANRLVQRLLNDVGENPDHLPLLQHALMRTWDRWTETDDPALDLQHYEHPSVGTMARALNIHAEQALDGMDAAQRRRTERLFRAVTDTDPDGRRVRRRVPLSELVALTGASRDEIRAIVERFQQDGRSFLFWSADPGRHPDPELDLSHESLMRQWTTLDEWVTSEAAARDEYLRLADRAEREDLLVGDALDNALAWKHREQPGAAWARRYHPELDASEADAVLKKTLAFIDRSRRSQSRRRMIIGLALLTLIGLTAFALIARKWAVEARESALQAQASTQIAYTRVDSLRRVAIMTAASEYRARLEADSLAVLAEREAGRARAAAAAARDSALAAQRARQAALDQAEAARIARESANSAQVAAEAARDTARTERGRTISLSLAAQAKRVQEQEANPTLGALLARQAFAFDSSGTFHDVIYDALRQNLEALESGSVQSVVTTLPDVVRATAYGPDGRLAAAGHDGTIHVLDGQGAEHVSTRAQAGVHTLVFSPDGTTLVTGGVDGIRLWQLPAAELRQLLPFESSAGSPEPLRSVRIAAFHPDGETLAVGGDAGVMVRPGSGAAPVRFEATDVRALAFTPDGAWLAAGSLDGTLTIWAWPPTRRNPIRQSTSSPVRTLAFSPSGDTLATAGGTDGRIYLWHIPDPEQGAVTMDTLRGHRGPVHALAFDPSGRWLASGSADRIVRAWPLDGSNSLLLTGHDDEIRSVAFVHDRNRLVLASGSFDRTVRRWNLDIGELADRVCTLVGRGLNRVEWTTYVGSDIRYAPACDESP